ncbi:hypothetical protein OSTOST_15231 [Ostertagia ostertagi]
MLVGLTGHRPAETLDVEYIILFAKPFGNVQFVHLATSSKDRKEQNASSSSSRIVYYPLPILSLSAHVVAGYISQKKRHQDLNEKSVQLRQLDLNQQPEQTLNWEVFETQKKQIQEALNAQTYHQFSAYAQQQFPGQPEQVW